MDEVVVLYKKLLLYLEEEQHQIGVCLQGDILRMYRELLERERKAITDNLNTLY